MFRYPPRTPVPPAGGGYSQQPLVQPYNSELVQGTRIRELQPEFSYQQGPTQWTTVSPIREGPYPISPGPGIASGYHMSSV
uniref:Uncharacterized protein n=1 Tax=Acrobeloides nanus TaxID=290746 RepID=A0A914DPL0_9BILA